MKFHMQGLLSAVVARFYPYPVSVAFVGSLVLSLVAVLGVATVGKDAAFYLDIARQASEQGLHVAQEQFHWPGFVLLLALTHQCLGLSLESAAYLWCALFIAGACGLLVDLVRRVMPRATWWAVLVVLAMPAYNEFRSEILREFGFWFFSVLALWLALRWNEVGGWLRALGVPLAVMAAAAFRLEAVLLFPALVIWQVPALFCPARRSRALQFYLMLGLLTLLGGLGLLGLLLMLDFPMSRLTYFAGLINPLQLLEAFNEFSAQFAESMAYKYSRGDAGQIVFFGLLAAILIKFLGMLGPFVVALGAPSVWRQLPALVRVFPLSAWAALLYLLVLMIFFVQMQFVNSRYASFLNLLLVPVVAAAMMVFAQNWPRLGRWVVALAVLTMLANVISLGAKKTHYIDAGRWLEQHVDAQASVYYVDGRIAYYAGRGYPIPDPLETVMAAPDRYRYLVIEADGDEPWLLEWLAQHDLRVLQRFVNRKDDAVLVIGR